MRYYIEASSDNGKPVGKGGREYLEMLITIEHASGKREVMGVLRLNGEKDGRAVHAEFSHVLTYAPYVDGVEASGDGEDQEIDRVTVLLDEVKES